MNKSLIIGLCTFLLLINFVSATISFNDYMFNFKGINVYDNATGTWTGHRGSNTAGDMFPDSVGNDSWISFTADVSKFAGLNISLDVNLSASNIECVWEYVDYNWGASPYNHSWTAFSNVVDNTNCLQNSGEVSWDMPTNWTENYYMVSSGDSSNYYYSIGVSARMRILNVTGMTEGGHHNARTGYANYAITITDGATHLINELHEQSVSNGWNVTTSLNNNYNKTILVNANILVEDGTLRLRDDAHLTVGKEVCAINVPGECYEFLLPSGGTLEMGALDGNGFAYDGATFTYHGGHSEGLYHYWYGTMKIYDSTISYPAVTSYPQLSFGTTFDIIDSSFRSNAGTWFFPSGGGNITRTIFQRGYLYVYIPTVKFDNIQFAWSMVDSSSAGIFSGGGNYLAKVDNTDYGTNSHSVGQRMGAALTDCKISEDNIVTTASYTIPQTIEKRYSINFTVVDNNGIPIENVTVTITDVDGRSLLYRDVMEQNSSAPGITDLDTITDNQFYTPNSSFYSVGDVLRLRGEIMNVTSIVSGTLVNVTRNLSGTVQNGVFSRSYGFFKRDETATTDSDGKIYYDNNVGGKILYKIPTFIEVATSTFGITQKYYNPITFKFEHDSYATKNFSYNVSDKFDWVINLESPCSSGGSAGLMFVCPSKMPVIS